MHRKPAIGMARIKGTQIGDRISRRDRVDALRLTTGKKAKMLGCHIPYHPRSLPIEKSRHRAPFRQFRPRTMCRHLRVRTYAGSPDSYQPPNLEYNKNFTSTHMVNSLIGAWLSVFSVLLSVRFVPQCFLLNLSNLPQSLQHCFRCSAGLHQVDSLDRFFGAEDVPAVVTQENGPTPRQRIYIMSI